jgi:DUF218 domain
VLSLPSRRWGTILVRALLAVVVIALVAWGVVAYRVIGHPGLDRATAADAVVVLGPVEVDGALAYAESLVSQGLAHTLLVSVAPGQRGPVGHLCWDDPPPLPGVSVTCFVPDPTTTRGEARMVSGLADSNHWHTLIVVTPTYHVERARMIFDRCPHGRLEFVAPADHSSAARWAFESLYQTAGFLKAALESGC